MSTLSRPPSWPTSIRDGSTRARTVPWGVLIVLAGLFGMHGLSDHGVCEDSGGPMPAHAVAMPDTRAVPVAGPLAVPVAVPMAVHGVVHETAVVPVASLLAGVRDGMSGGVADLCLAFLTGFLLGLASWLMARRPSAVALGVPRLAPLPRPRGRDPDPPTPARLSVWRC